MPFGGGRGQKLGCSRCTHSKSSLRCARRKYSPVDMCIVCYTQVSVVSGGKLGVSLMDLGLVYLSRCRKKEEGRRKKYAEEEENDDVFVVNGQCVAKEEASAGEEENSDIPWAFRHVIPHPCRPALETWMEIPVANRARGSHRRRPQVCSVDAHPWPSWTSPPPVGLDVILYTIVWCYCRGQLVPPWLATESQCLRSSTQVPPRRSL